MIVRWKMREKTKSAIAVIICFWCFIWLIWDFVQYKNSLEPSVIEPNICSIANDGFKAVQAAGGRVKRSGLENLLKEKWSIHEIEDKQVEEYARYYYVIPISSSIDNPLETNEWGLASVQGRNGQMLTSAVWIDNVYNDAAATRLIEEHHGRKQVAEEGCHFVVVEYSTTVSFQDAYLESRLLGLDGKSLEIDGTRYPQRTYDMLDAEQKDKSSNSMPVHTNRYVYYEVPDGCTEYVLSFGWHMPRYQGVLQTANWIFSDEKGGLKK